MQARSRSTGDGQAFEGGGEEGGSNGHARGVGACSGTRITGIEHGQVAEGGAAVREVHPNPDRAASIDEHVLEPRPSCVHFDGGLGDAGCFGPGTSGSADHKAADVRDLVVRVIGVVLLVQIDAAVHAVRDGEVLDDRTGTDAVVDVTDNQAGVRAVDLHALQQRDAVFDPRTGHEGPC